MLGGEDGLENVERMSQREAHGKWGCLCNWGIGLGDWDDINESPWRLNSRVFIQSGPGGELQICFPG